MMNLSVSTVAPLALVLTLFGGTAISRSLAPTGAHQEGAGVQEGKADHEDDEHGEHGEHENALHENMERMQRCMKGLRKLLGKPDRKADAIALCVSMEGAALKGFLHPPESAEGPEDLEGSELHAYQADFKKRILAVTGLLVDLELALDKGDADKAKELYRALGAAKNAGHDIYIE